MTAPMPVGVREVDLRDPAQCARITAFVEVTDGGTPFHLPAWSLAVQDGCGQRAHYLVSEREGAIVGVLPLTEMRSSMFGRALVSTGFALMAAYRVTRSKSCRWGLGTLRCGSAAPR
ncbi:hypothetical protein [Sphingomonas faeni]|uniref:hypothetical protein n=1 Tax=Sphingomonas faeni TaxID=185950 RepID=UPI002782B045|nr:hypothetical protein [Sphingomonas faeni]MDQ0837643.1 hypothetical protein [Sphingomonas faeni]